MGEGDIPNAVVVVNDASNEVEEEEVDDTPNPVVDDAPNLHEVHFPNPHPVVVVVIFHQKMAKVFDFLAMVYISCSGCSSSFCDKEEFPFDWVLFEMMVIQL